MEIIGNISKQKDQIEKILSDTKDLQKEINTLSGRLERSFAVAEEKIYRVCKWLKRIISLIIVPTMNNLYI